MKKLISLIIILAALLSLTSCEKYKPVPSTEEEARVVMVLSLDGEKYEVKYELYRAMFLAYKSMVDEGDSSVWASASSAEYVARVQSLIISRITDIYAALHHAKKLGIDMYSKSVDSQIEEYITLSIEGGVYGNETILGYGSYDAYLESLAKSGMNYSVSDLIYRYNIAIDLITKHYAGTLNDEGTAYEGGALQYTEEDVRAFYFGEDSVRYMSAFIQSEYADARSRADIIRMAMLTNEGDDNRVATTIIGNTISSATDVKNGTLIGRYNLDEENYGDITKEAFATPTGRVSSVIEVYTGAAAGFYILYPISKTEDHLKANYAEIALTYVQNEMGRQLESVQAALTESLGVTDVFRGIDHASITYPTVNK